VGFKVLKIYFKILSQLTPVTAYATVMLKVLFCSLTIAKMRIIGYPLHKRQVIFFFD
jgi:hypothetical protein